MSTMVGVRPSSTLDYVPAVRHMNPYPLGDSKKSGAIAEGQTVLLNGTSSTGKSTLIITLQDPFGVMGYKFGVIR